MGQTDNEHPFKDTDRHAGEGGHRIDGPAECWTPNTTLVRQRKAVGIDSQPAGFWSQATCASGRLKASRARPPLARLQGRSKTYKNTVTRWYVQSPPVLLLITLTPSSLHMRCTEFTHPEPPAPLDEGSGAAKPTWCVKYLGAAGSARPQTGHGADIVGGWRWAGADLQGLQPFGRGTLAPAVWIWGRGMLPFSNWAWHRGTLGCGGGGGVGGLVRIFATTPDGAERNVGIERQREGCVGDWAMRWELLISQKVTGHNLDTWTDTWRILFSQLGLFGGDEGNDEKRSPKPMTKIPHHSCPGELCLVWLCPAPSQKDIKVGWGKRKAGRWGGRFVRPTCSGVRTTCNRAEAHAGLRGWARWGSHQPRAGAPSVAMN